MSSLKFYDRLCQIRLTAAVLYDRGRALGHGHEELADDIRPLMQTLQKERAEAADSDLAGVVMAIRSLESEAQKHELDVKFLTEKAASAREHVALLKQELHGTLTRRGITERIEGDFSVTLVDGNITVR